MLLFLGSLIGKPLVRSRALLRISIPQLKLDSVLSDVALEVKLCTFGNETLTTFLTTALDAITTCLGGHTSTEAMLLFAGTFGWLVSAEAHGGFLGEICSPIQAAGAGL